VKLKGETEGTPGRPGRPLEMNEPDPTADNGDPKKPQCSFYARIGPGEPDGPPPEEAQIMRRAETGTSQPPRGAVA